MRQKQRDPRTPNDAGFGAHTTEPKLRPPSCTACFANKGIRTIDCFERNLLVLRQAEQSSKNPHVTKAKPEPSLSTRLNPEPNARLKTLGCFDLV